MESLALEGRGEKDGRRSAALSRFALNTEERIRGNFSPPSPSMLDGVAKMDAVHVADDINRCVRGDESHTVKQNLWGCPQQLLLLLERAEKCVCKSHQRPRIYRVVIASLWNRA